MPSPLNSLDPFNLKQQLARLDDVRALGERFVSDLDAARTARRALLPLPLVDRPGRRRRPRSFRRSRRARSRRCATSGSGWCCPAAAAHASRRVGVARALEEAGIEPQAISVCSGSALWGSMMASGLSAQEMVNQSLNWQPEDYLDIQWTRLPRFAMAAMRGFTGLAKGEAIEKLFDRQLWHMTLGETPIPIYSEVYNIDLSRLETFGSKLDSRPHDRASWCGSRSRCRCWSSRCGSTATSTRTAAWWTCSPPSR